MLLHARQFWRRFVAHAEARNHDSSCSVFVAGLLRCQEINAQKSAGPRNQASLIDGIGPDQAAGQPLRLPAVEGIGAPPRPHPRRRPRALRGPPQWQRRRRRGGQEVGARRRRVPRPHPRHALRPPAAGLPSLCHRGGPVARPGAHLPRGHAARLAGQVRRVRVRGRRRGRRAPGADRARGGPRRRREAPGGLRRLRALREAPGGRQRRRRHALRS